MHLKTWGIFFSLYRHQHLYFHSSEGAAVFHLIISTFDIPEFSREGSTYCVGLGSFPLKLWLVSENLHLPPFPVNLRNTGSGMW